MANIDPDSQIHHSPRSLVASTLPARCQHPSFSASYPFPSSLIFIAMAFQYQYRISWRGRRYIKDIQFQNYTEAMTYQMEMSLLKEHSAQLNAIGQQEQLPWENWLKQCYTWVNQWGGHRVPIDIRSSMNETENEFGLPSTSFGPDVGATYLP